MARHLPQFPRPTGGLPGRDVGCLLRAWAVALLFGGVACGTEEEAPPPYDLLVQGGVVVDGTGADRFEADVAVKGDRIARVAPDGVPADSARELVDVRGLVVAPGFVDHHAHVGTAVLERPLLENFLRQGITTVVASPHAQDQPWPLRSHMEAVEAAPNMAFFAGHGWVRKEVVGEEDRAPTEAELERMKGLVARSMREGALGLSTGLEYGPGAYAGTDEVVELARVAARHGGLYYTHLRNEGPRLVESVEEALEVGRRADLPVQVQHLKAFGPPQWGRTREALAVMDSARAEGLDVKHDVYPYAAASTSSSVLFPAWALEGGADSLQARLDDPESRERIEREMREMWLAEWTGEDLDRVRFRSVPAEPEYRGRTLAEVVRDRGLPNDVDAGIEVALELQVDGGFTAVVHGMDERDVIRVMAHPQAMFQTDGDAVGHGVGHPHPRSYGAFPRVIRRYVLELEVLSVEEAIHRMTGLSMEQLGQRDRGVVEAGRYADLVALDLATVTDRATYMDPHRHSVGVVHSVVNGVPVLRDGSLTGRTPGRVLRGPAR